MAVLSDTDRAALWAQLMRETSATHDALPLLKAELRAVIDAADTWADTNAAAFNLALPQPGRGVLTAKQKARVLMLVISQRWVVTP